MIIAGSAIFDTCCDRYEAWFDRHQSAYYSELLAVRALLPRQGLGLEIGVGTGRFAAPLGVKTGVDPSGSMLSYAIKRGISVCKGIAEALPFRDGVFDYGLIITTLCFVNDPTAMLTEACRTLKPQASLVVGFIDRTSALGRYYLNHQTESVFYREATFYSASEAKALLNDAGFTDRVWAQTLSKPLNEIRDIEPFREGSGRGAFVVVGAVRL